MTLTEQQIELLKATSLQDGRNAWEYIHLYEENSRGWPLVFFPAFPKVLTYCQRSSALRQDT